MAITNEKTLAKMKKKNLKSIVVGKDGSITKDGKTFKNKKEFKERDRSSEKPKGSFFERFIEGRKSKEAKAAKASVASGKANTAATKKMYAAESMFKSAKAKDEAKVKPGKARSFKEAFDAATKAGKDSFRVEGKSYLTTKGKRKDRFPVTTDKKSAATPKKSLREKLTGFKSQKGFEDARDKRRIEKRIANIKKRKNAGKSFSAKNLSELEAKLK